MCGNASTTSRSGSSARCARFSTSTRAIGLRGFAMRAVVVYESMFGNTRKIAEAIGAGLRSFDDVEVAPVGAVTPELLAEVDLLVVGGPTHAWDMSRPSTRQSAVATAHSGLTLEPDADGPGLREWFASLGELSCRAVAFDTRIKIPAALSGRAAKGIGRRLRQRGCTRLPSRRASSSARQIS